MYEKLIKKCQEAVSIESISGNEKKFAGFLKNTMDELNYDQTWVDELGNVIGLIKGNGEGTILLQGHLDTVCVENPELWEYDPFGGEIVNGRIYGRGSSDMKSALMAMVFAGAAMINEKNKLKGNIAVTGVVHEEIFEGVAQGKVLDQINPDLVILGESSRLRLCIGQRGRAEIQIKTFGKSAHSSNPEAGINAIKKMMKLLSEIKNIALPVDRFLGPAIMELTDILSRPYPGQSVIPEECMVTFDRRLLPEETEETVLKPIKDIINKLQTEDNKFKAEAKIVEAEADTYTGKKITARRFFPGWAYKENDTFVQRSVKALKKNGFKGEISHYSFCTDGSQSAGIRKIPTLGFGPSREDLAHVRDEYIETNNIKEVCRGYIAILKEFLTGDVEE
jgi:putative selenium metabolism hydrolase